MQWAHLPLPVVLFLSIHLSSAVSSYFWNKLLCPLYHSSYIYFSLSSCQHHDITRPLCAVAGRCGTAASRSSELSCSQSQMFDELEAIAPRSTSSPSMNEPSDSSSYTSPDKGRHTNHTSVSMIFGISVPIYWRLSEGEPSWLSINTF